MPGESVQLECSGQLKWMNNEDGVGTCGSILDGTYANYGPVKSVGTSSEEGVPPLPATSEAKTQTTTTTTTTSVGAITTTTTTTATTTAV